MKNSQMITFASRQLAKVCENIQVALDTVNYAEELNVDVSAYEGILLDSITHAQMITLEMTKLVSGQDVNTDSIFAPGELDHKSGVEIENPVEKEDE